MTADQHSLDRSSSPDLWRKPRLLVSRPSSLKSPANQSVAAVSQERFEQFVRYSQISSAAYQNGCASPPQGIELVKELSDVSTNTQGFVAVDRSANEMVVALRGTSNLQDAFTDLKFRQVDYQSLGVSGCQGCKVRKIQYRRVLRPSPRVSSARNVRSETVLY